MEHLTQPDIIGLTREYYREKYNCTIDLLFHLFGLVCFENKNNNCPYTADSKPVNQEVNITMILPPLVFHVFTLKFKTSFVTLSMGKHSG